jgi:hypothetical protein
MIWFLDGFCILVYFTAISLEYHDGLHELYMSSRAMSMFIHNLTDGWDDRTHISNKNLIELN